MSFLEYEKHVEHMTVGELARSQPNTENLVFSVSNGEGGRDFYSFEDYMKVSKEALDLPISIVWITSTTSVIVNQEHRQDGASAVLIHKSQLVKYPVWQFEAIQAYARERAEQDESVLRDYYTDAKSLTETAYDTHIDFDVKQPMPSVFHCWTDNVAKYAQIFADAYIKRYRELSLARFDKLIKKIS